MASNARKVTSSRFPMGVGTSVSIDLFHIIFLAEFLNASSDVSDFITSCVEWVAKA